MSENVSSTVDTRVNALETTLRMLIGEWNETRALVGLGPGATGAKIRAVLNVDRGTAQRLARASRMATSGVADLEQMPGTAAWERVVAGVERSLGESHAHAQRLAYAVSKFAESLEMFGGSLAAAARALRERRPPEGRGAAGQRAIGRSLSDAFAAMMGYCVDVRLSILAYRPNPQSPELLDEAMLQSLQGCSGTSGSHPIVLRRFRTTDGSRLSPSATSGDARGISLLRAGTSVPPPEMLSTGDEHSQVVMLDPAWADRTDRLSVTSLVVDRAAGPMPWASPPPVLEVETLNRYPSRRLLLLYLVHRDVDLGGTATFGAFGDRRIDGLGRPWFDRLPEHATLVRNTDSWSTCFHEASPAFSDIVREMFERLGWDPEPFVGYQVQVDSPVPLARYVFQMQWFDRE
jgi:hypothetical protein